jgi:glycosyltransferase involved in cell wall biosynthesis
MHPSNNNYKNPLVSILLCTYNGAQFVEAQLETVCNQTYKNLEIIIVDDCSTDSTLEILNKFAKQDSRICLFQNEYNLGYNKNFNKAIHLAKGEFIAFCDQDDLWEEKKIEILLNAWPENKPLIYSDSVRFEGDLNKKACKKNDLYRRFEGDDPRKLAIFNTISGHALMIKRDFVKWVVPFPEHIFYDWWMAVVAAANGGVAYVDEILVYQRTHNHNVSFGEQAHKGFKSKKEAFNDLVTKHLFVFLNTPNSNDSNINFFQQLYDLWGHDVTKRSRIRLFIFLLKNRNLLFWYKRRKMPFLSHLKHSFLLSLS